MEAAIAVVGKARNDMLTHTLIDFLMGETDGVPKDPNYIYRLYMALGSYSQAAKTAIIIAKQEQDLGNYKVSFLFVFYANLSRAKPAARRHFASKAIFTGGAGGMHSIPFWAHVPSNMNPEAGPKHLDGRWTRE